MLSSIVPAPAWWERLGVDYEAVKRYNPRVVYAAASGWGSKGSEAQDGVV